MKRFEAVITTTLVLLLVLAPTAGAADLQATLVTPANGSTVAVGASSIYIPVEFATPLAIDTRNSYAWVEFATEPTFGQDGTLADDKVVGVGMLYRRDSDPTHWYGTVAGRLSTPGVYYFQISISAYFGDLTQSCPGFTGGMKCLFASPVYSMTVTAPAAPTAPVAPVPAVPVASAPPAPPADAAAEDVPARPAENEDISLGYAEATAIARTALSRKYGATWRTGRSRAVSCVYRTDTERTCRASWVRRNVRYSVTVSVREWTTRYGWVVGALSRKTVVRR